MLDAPQLRWYGIPAARTKGKWLDMPQVMRLAPSGWKPERPGRAVYKLLIRYYLTMKNPLWLVEKAVMPGPGLRAPTHRSGL